MKANVEEALLDVDADQPGKHLGVREEVKKQLWLAGPLIAGALLQNVIQMISVMYVGHLGELPLAGASMANSFTSVTGLTVLVSTYSPGSRASTPNETPLLELLVAQIRF
ncbi:hypothetical protein SETIT_4G145600v2 [Setaria italica]|uniref:Protein DETOXIFICATION n=2 Tax=Setaria TaxID=4554 RepID=K3Y071_SETIT|nr:hypothetical protein SETIT_4G145600v2 [Setaria italica]TKW21308.1 hypothetical protein SEVIR_4G167700v2 [Setaria viridis]